MDLAYSYDHIINTSRSATPTPPDPLSTSDDPTIAAEPPTPKASQSQPVRQNLQTEFQETFKAFSASPWGAKLGGLWGNVRKQGGSYYEEAAREAEAARIDAVKGFNDIREGIVGRVRSLSINEKEALDGVEAQQKLDEKREPIPGEEPIPSHTVTDNDEDLLDTEGFLEKFKATAALRLKEVQKAEDAADEALLRFGTTIRSFLRDAVAVSAPDDSEQPGEVLFESKDAAGKRTIHANRMDAQLHLIHTSTHRFLSDPADSGEEWDAFKSDFDVEKRTEGIARDLDVYPELRRTMESLVPEKVQYAEFWARYYFLRQALEAQEQKRKELLKASTTTTEAPSWDDSDEEAGEDDEHKLANPQIIAQNTNNSSSTINQSQSQSHPSTSGTISSSGLKPEGRRSHDEKSVADSEASYDIVSGTQSRAASSPKEKKAEESDDDWE